MKFNKLLILILALFYILTALYFLPMMKGKVLSQHDIKQWKGGAKEITEFKKETGENTAWTNSMFSGMPSYLVTDLFDGNVLVHFFQLRWTGIPYPATSLLIALICMFLFMRSFGLNVWLSTLGAVAFAFASFNLISLSAGHNAKVVAIAYMPLLLAGLNWLFRKDYLLGAAVLMIGIAAELNPGHYQITYYLFLITLIYLVAQLVQIFKCKDFKHLAIVAGIGIAAAIVGVGPGVQKLLTVKEYGEYSIRGKSELKATSESTEGSGLDRDYAFAWSMGTAENLTFLVPNLFGGASTGKLDETSAAYEAFRSKGAGKRQALQQVQRMPMYWGDQSFTAGPVYLGAIVCFLFVLGLLVLGPKWRWWLGISTVLGLILSMGKNMPAINYFLFDTLPGLNKFRTPSMAVVICHLTFATGAGLALHRIFFDKEEIEDLWKKIYIALGITGGLSLFFALFGSWVFNFEGANDGYIAEQAPWLLDALIEDRKSLASADAWRSVILIGLAFASIWAVLKNKLKTEYGMIALVLLVLVDLWAVDKRYLNEENFVKKGKDSYFTMTPADQSILSDKDIHYRVFNVQNPFNEARTSYFHKSIGGYHGAKMRRYQDVIEKHLSQNNAKVLAMLNAKYVITDLSKPAQRLQNAGNAWFVDSLVVVNNPDDEITFLGKDEFLPKVNAVIDGSKFNPSKTSFVRGNRGVKLTSYEPNRLKYTVQTEHDAYLVFSEIYYPEGWKVTLDGQEVAHQRVNYILRGMEVPKGKHEIEFYFHPTSYYTGETISKTLSYVLILSSILLLGFSFYIKGKKD